MSTVALVVNSTEITAPATLDALIVNRDAGTLNYGAEYAVEYWDGKSWERTDFTDGIVFSAIGIILGPDGIGDPDTVEIPAEAQSGFYRVTKKATEEGTGESLELYGLFHISDSAAA